MVKVARTLAQPAGHQRDTCARAHRVREPVLITEGRHRQQVIQCSHDHPQPNSQLSEHPRSEQSASARKHGSPPLRTASATASVGKGDAEGPAQPHAEVILIASLALSERRSCAAALTSATNAPNCAPSVGGCWVYPRRVANDGV